MSLLANGITPNWNKWINVPNVMILEGVDLSLNIESPHYDPFSSDHHCEIAEHLTSKGLKEHGDRLLVATRNLGEKSALYPVTIDESHPETSSVSLPEFAAWACSIGWEVPEEFTKIGEQYKGLTKANSKWPWGDYETEDLRKLAAAAHNWWSTYDPENKSTAPKNADVSKWLEGHGVSQRVAEVMAQILRADDLPTGPRK